MNDLRVITRDVTPQECPWLRATLTAGTTVRRFHKSTYGCIDHNRGTAVTFDLENGDYPFLEVPTDALAEVVEP
jgi:hypothetical protein